MHQLIPIPALAYPVTVLISVTPSAVMENTIRRRVSVVTGIAKPVSTPLLMVPRANTPVRGGAKVTRVPAIGVKVLSGVGEL